MPELKNRIETPTEGRVKVNTPPKSLAAPPDQYDGVVGGVMDGALQFNAFITNQVPSVQLSMLPFINGTRSAVAGPAMWETYQTFFADKDEYGDAVLDHFDNCPSITHNKVVRENNPARTIHE